MFGFTIISKKRLRHFEEMALNENNTVAYINAYNTGYLAGQLDAVTNEYTPNEIREIFGFEPSKDFAVKVESNELRKN